MLDGKGNGNRLLQRLSVPLHTAGKLDDIHVNLLIGMSMQEGGGSALPAREVEVLQPAGFVGSIGKKNNTFVKNRLRFNSRQIPSILLFGFYFVPFRFISVLQRDCKDKERQHIAQGLIND